MNTEENTCIQRQVISIRKAPRLLNAERQGASPLAARFASVTRDTRG